MVLVSVGGVEAITAVMKRVAAVAVLVALGGQISKTRCEREH